MVHWKTLGYLSRSDLSTDYESAQNAWVTAPVFQIVARRMNMKPHSFHQRTKVVITEAVAAF